MPNIQDNNAGVYRPTARDWSRTYYTSSTAEFINAFVGNAGIQQDVQTESYDIPTETFDEVYEYREMPAYNIPEPEVFVEQMREYEEFSNNRNSRLARENERAIERQRILTSPNLEATIPMEEFDLVDSLN